jgi:hypothetical protein
MPTMLAFRLQYMNTDSGMKLEPWVIMTLADGPAGGNEGGNLERDYNALAVVRRSAVVVWWLVRGFSGGNDANNKGYEPRHQCRAVSRAMIMAVYDDDHDFYKGYE